MTLHYEDDRVTLWHGDCRDVLANLPDASVDACVTDPPYELGFMGKGWDASGIAYDVDLWRDVLRVLKPGGHLLAFGGSRTWHRLVCAVEDAGFEVRDSIAWLYASGFPKSLDVSKAIDKAAGAEREVVGEGQSFGRGAMGNRSRVAAGYRPTEINPDGGVSLVTAPATPDAARWQGWGTALKPAFEPIVVARKPLALPGTNVLALIESQLKTVAGVEEIRWSSAPARDVARRETRTTSSSTGAPPAGATSAAHAAASVTQNGARRSASDSGNTDARGGQPTSSTRASIESSTPQHSEPKSSPHMAESATVAANQPSSSSPSTTSGAAGLLTEKPHGERSTRKSSVKDSPLATESFAGIATGLTGSRSHVRIERLSDGTFVWPDGLPTSVPGAPATVAANVLEHGTGALNIDGCRVAADWTSDPNRRGWQGGNSQSVGVTGNFGNTGERVAQPKDAGRWPSNVVLSHAADCGPDDAPVECVEGCPVRELDEQSGDRPGMGIRSLRRGVESGRGLGGGDTFEGGAGTVAASLAGYDDSGGASRFFPAFRYEPKAPTDERPRVKADADDERLGGQTTTRCTKCGKQRVNVGSSACQCAEPEFVRERSEYIAHPTVKPLDLMRWLVRLVTPPGGVVLEPFAGSGTTCEAAVAEGFRCIAVEQEAAYLPLITQRLTKRSDPVAHLASKGEDLGLFELLDGEAS